MNISILSKHHWNTRIPISVIILFLSSFSSTQIIAQEDLTSGGSVTANQIICLGETPELLANENLPTGGTESLPIEYLWMTRTSSAGQWVPATGTNDQVDYQPSFISSTTFFIRCARRQGFNNFVAETNIITISLGSTPTALITTNPGSGSTGSTISFEAAYNFNGTYKWDFDGDGIIDCTDRTCEYTFNSSGNYNISLTVGNASCEITTSGSIEIEDPKIFRINDPCLCSNPRNFSQGNTFFVHDYIWISSDPGESWTISDIISGALYDVNGDLMEVDKVIPETNTAGRYYIDIWFVSGVGFEVEVSNGNFLAETGTDDPCACTVPLPVELVNFEAVVNEQNNVLLRWATASEINNSHFEIERSLDGARFDYIDFVGGQGNSTTLNNYQLTDNNAVKGETYYRLKQIDYDGSYEFSDIVSVKIDSDQIITAMIPNPVSEKTIVRFNPNISIKSKLEVRTASGQLVKTYQVQGSAQEINLSELERGIYFLNIKNAAKKENAFYKFIKI